MMMAVVSKSMTFLSCICLITLYKLGHSDSSFNYEIGFRVQDTIAEYLSKINSVAKQPSEMLKRGLILPASFETSKTAFNASQIMLFTLKVVYYDELNSVGIGFDNGVFLTYSNDASKYLSVSYADTTKRRNRYTVLSNGLPKKFSSNDTFDLKKRPPYVQAKAANAIIWSSPFILQTLPAKPGIAIVYPIFNTTFAGVYKTFAGAFILTITLDQISSFLVKTFKDTNRNVFIVEKSSGILMANSLGASISTTSNGVSSMLTALKCENSIIVGVTKSLMDSNWPDTLVIYEGNYLQCSLYVDPIPGISWYIIVLLPAVLEPDHLGPDSPLYFVSIAFATIAIIASFICLMLTLYYWRLRMMQLSQPLFSVAVQIGCILLSGSCFTFLGENNQSNCSARAFLFNIAFTFAFSPLLVKCFQVYAKFVRTWRANVLVHGGSNKLMSPLGLAIYLLVFVVIDILITVITVYSSPGSEGTAPYSTTLKSTNDAYSQFIFCGYHANTAFFYAELGYKGFLILLSCYLSIAIRSVSDAIAGSKALLVIIYNTAIIGGIVIALNRGLSSVRLVILCQVMGICVCVVIAAVMMIAPTLYVIVYVGDQEAAAAVIDDMFKARQNAAVKSNLKKTTNSIKQEIAGKFILEKDNLDKGFCGARHDPTGRGYGLYSISSIATENNYRPVTRNVMVKECNKS